MAWDEKGTTKEVESLKKRFPKRGIDPTIPAGVRETLRDREGERMMSAGEKNRYARGGMARGKMVRMADGGETPTPIKAPAQYQPGYQSPTPSTALPTPIKGPAQYQPGYQSPATQPKVTYDKPSDFGFAGTTLRNKFADIQRVAEQKALTPQQIKQMQITRSDAVKASSAANKAKALATPVKKAKGGKIDGCAQRGKTRGKVV